MGKVKRTNKTESNLQKVWDQLDDAAGSLDQATYNLATMVDLPIKLVDEIDRLDISAIVIIRDKIGELIEEKRIMAES